VNIARILQLIHLVLFVGSTIWRDSGLWICCKYNCSTFLRAHGVLRRNFRLDFKLGSCIKQRIGKTAAIASQPMLSDSCVTMASSVIPSKLGGAAGLFRASEAFEIVIVPVYPKKRR